MPLTRRAFLTGAAASAIVVQRHVRAQGPDVFAHGVASGDPLADRVVIWTRVSPRVPGRQARVRWTVLTDTPAPTVVRSGTALASTERDHTIKVDVAGLEPGRTYLYRFEAEGEQSATGRTRTLPRVATRVRLAVVSCSNYPAGYFNAYGAIAAGRDVDAVVHLGDYIYEFANGTFGDGTSLGRIPDPEHEAITLDDYRRRYAIYRRDPDLQLAHRLFPFMTIWDDHEFADNAWAGGVDGWDARRRAAMRAYLEWMPVREPRRGPFHLYRRFDFGNLASLSLLDARSLRDGQVFATDVDALRDPRRRVLGAVQEQWLRESLQAARQAGTAWSLIGQQVMFSPFTPPHATIKNPDAWDGYQAERARIREMLAAAANPVILTGDVHSSWAFDVPLNPWTGYDPASGEGSVAVELITPAISSEPYFTGNQKATLEPDIRRTLPHLKYLEGEHRGYLRLDIDAARVSASWYLTPDVQQRSAETRLDATYVVESGARRLSPG